jgi:putative ABC transport system permease protein
LVARVLRQRHGLDRDQPDDFMVLTPAAVQQKVATVQRVLLLYIPLVAAIVLLVGAVVAATLMLASVNGRLSEIGVRRAVGARPEDIRWQFAIETALTVLAGGLGGIVLALAGTELVASRMNLGTTLSWKAVLLGLVASAVTGLLAGVAPAQRAAQLDPVQALR